MSTALESASSGYASSSSTTTTTRTRRWVRRDHVVMPFVWWGLLPLLGLLALLWYAVMPFARHTIESSVRGQTQAVLAKAGHGWANVDVSGQHVVLTGSPPSAAAGPAAIAAAEAATCSTWTGERTCAVDVVGKFAAAAPVPVVAPPPVAAPAPAAIQETAKKCEKALADLVASRNIEFATSKADVLASSNALLDEIAKAAKDCPGKIEVQGHTDSIGSPEMNKSLSDARAKSVVAALAKRGIDETRLAGVGFGLEKPIADNATKEGRAKNRRIEFKVITN